MGEIESEYVGKSVGERRGEDGGERKGGGVCFRATARLFVWLDTASPILNLILG